ncbi:phosphotransacetylase family protein [Natranaerofaba carboxydovora]|uniref:phosphotransacetylase family protein n=1 Tax=Natranaerofaba carboxydovora TaxID=2742683 RepID=UPI001F12DF5A|nr:DRTGG domain-containing protein [Natranaerofaba carboxydovora]UMZ74324.1 Phosphate acetyltransferase [Natranaerofaba carboxydovora]
MKKLYVMGASGSGKTTVSLGLAMHLCSKGYKVKYFKPIGYSPWPTQKEDEDGLLLKDVLQTSCDLSSIVPVNVGPMYLSGRENKEDYRKAVFEAFDRIKNEDDADVLIVGGSTSPYILASQGLDCISLASEFEASVLLTSVLKDDFSFDQTFFFNKHLEALDIPVLGNIFNNTPLATYEKTKGIHKVKMEEEGYNVLGIIPAMSELTSPTVNECLDVLGGELLVGKDNLDKRVEDIVVGTMTIESGLKYLRRSTNKALIIGGDRSDLALTALETSTSVLILTGGLYPNVKVLSQAEEKNVPVILVHYDTYTTVEKLHDVSTRIKPGNKESMELARDNIKTYCDLDILWDYLGEN